MKNAAMAQSTCFAMLMAAVSAMAAPDLIIQDVTVIDGTGAAARNGVSVSVGDGIIQSIGERPENIDGAELIDGTGRFLIPGLMDMHVHLQGGARVTPEGLRDLDNDRKRGLHALHSYLVSGVTSIYDAGNNPDFIFGLRDEERADQIVSPRIFATGGIVTYPGSHGAFAGATLVDSWPEAIPHLDAHIARKPDLLKLTYEERGWGSRPMIPKLPVDLMQRIVEYYNDRGIRTTVHTSSEYRARQAIFAGIDTLAHPIIQGPITEDFARLMAAKQIPMVTTLTIGENYSRLAEHPEYLDQKLYRDVLDDREITRLKTEVRKEYQERKWTWWMKIMTGIAQENVRMVNAAGGVLTLGTDQTLGPAVHREMELLQDAGIPPEDIIRIATLNGARFLGLQNSLGSIEVGKHADLVLLDKNPLSDINNAKSITKVIKGGHIVDLDKLSLPRNAR